eukprot:4839442-Amphidinium_carterae.1
MASKTPWSSKIQCTLQTQAPELFERVSSLVAAIKQEGVKESQEKAKTVASDSKSTLNLTVGSEDEVIVKIIKKPKTESASGAGTSV